MGIPPFWDLKMLLASNTRNSYKWTWNFWLELRNFQTTWIPVRNTCKKSCHKSWDIYKKTKIIIKSRRENQPFWNLWAWFHDPNCPSSLKGQLQLWEQVWDPNSLYGELHGQLHCPINIFLSTSHVKKNSPDFEASCKRYFVIACVLHIPYKLGKMKLECAATS